MHKSDLEQHLRQLGRRLAASVACRAALEGAGIAAFGAGLTVIVLRVGLGAPSSLLGWIASAWTLVPLALIVNALRTRPNADSLAAIADARLAAGGRIMAGVREPGLAQRIATLRVVADLRQPAGVPAVALAFLAGALLVPARAVDPGSAGLDVRGQIEEQRADLEALREAELIEQPEAEALFAEALEIRTRLLGDEHPETKIAQEELAAARRALDPPGAEPQDG